MNRIKEFRVEKGITQKELASTVKLSIASISYFERGVKRPSLLNAFKVANALGTTVEELYPFMKVREGESKCSSYK